MRFSIVFLGFLLGVCIGLPASADNEGGLRQKLFEMDKQAALASFDTSQQRACIEAFDSRYQSEYRLNGTLTLNEPLSRIAYDRLFWKGESSVQRGLIFDASVTDRSGSKAGKVICYYAVTDYRLDFQNAYMLPLPMKEAASGGRSTIQASSINLLSKE